MKISKPSQLDNWYLYEKLELDKIRQATGEQAVYDWRQLKLENRQERERCARVREFRSSIGATPIRTTIITRPPRLTMSGPPQRSAMRFEATSQQPGEGGQGSAGGDG